MLEVKIFPRPLQVGMLAPRMREAVKRYQLGVPFRDRDARALANGMEYLRSAIKGAYVQERIQRTGKLKGYLDNQERIEDDYPLARETVGLPESADPHYFKTIAKPMRALLRNIRKGSASRNSPILKSTERFFDKLSKLGIGKNYVPIEVVRRAI